MRDGFKQGAFPVILGHEGGGIVSLLRIRSPFLLTNWNIGRVRWRGSNEREAGARSSASVRAFIVVLREELSG